jgi:hypothetical protein
MAQACATADEVAVETLIGWYQGTCGSNPVRICHRKNHNLIFIFIKIITGSLSYLLTATATNGQDVPSINIPTVLNTITSPAQASMESIISISSVSSELAAQTRTGNGNPNSINTATVAASDPRINYEPSSSWIDTSTQSGVGSCNNGTRVTHNPQAKFTFVFHGEVFFIFLDEFELMNRPRDGYLTQDCALF